MKQVPSDEDFLAQVKRLLGSTPNSHVQRKLPEASRAKIERYRLKTWPKPYLRLVWTNPRMKG